MLKLDKRVNLGGEVEYFPSQDVSINFDHVDIKIDQGPGQHFVAFVIQAKEGVSLKQLDLKTEGQISWACDVDSKPSSGGMGLDKHELALLNWDTATLMSGKNNDFRKEVTVQYR